MTNEVNEITNNPIEIDVSSIATNNEGSLNASISNSSYSLSLNNFDPSVDGAISLHNLNPYSHEDLFGSIEEILDFLSLKSDAQDLLIASKAAASAIPSKVSELENDSNFISDISGKLNISLDNVSSAGENKIKSFLSTSVAFCANSGNTTAGKVDLLSYSGAILSFKVGETYPVLRATQADGVSFERTSLASVDMSSFADGTYNIFAGSTGIPYALVNNICRQANEPSSPSVNDIWLNTSVEPFVVYKYDGTNWDTVFNDVLIGKVTVTSNTITSVETVPFNQNGFNINSQTQGYRMPNYNNGINKTWNTTYTADTDGWLLYLVGTYNLGTVYLTLNNDVIPNGGTFLYNTLGNWVLFSGFMPISKGDTCKFSGGVNGGGLIFFPAKGAN